MRQAKGSAPLVTGVSPNQGFPGDTVTIRGEHLGRDASDLIALFICGRNCQLTAEWCSSKKIVARTAACRGAGDIVVVTKSGGQGTSNVQYTGLVRSARHIDPLKEYPAWVEENLSRTQASSTPLNMRSHDPLGVSEESGPLYSEQQLQELCPGASSDFTRENFSSHCYLLENHSGTGFDALKAGLRHMKEQASERADKPLSFAKTNVTAYLACQDTLAKVLNKMQEDKAATTTGNLTSQLRILLQDANDAAGGLFEEVLRRKEHADRTRSALSVLQRFRFLFQLPGSMDKAISKGDYDLVISDYNKAKQLFASTEVELFKTVYAEVERRISRLRTTLEEQLLELPAPLEQQTRCLKYLLSLGEKGDPTWKLLTHEHKWILRLMTESRDTWLQRESNAAVSDSTSVSSGIPWHKGRSVKLLSDSDSTCSSADGLPGAAVSPGTPPRVAFLQQLCAIISQTLPAMCALAEYCFSGAEAQNHPAITGRSRADSQTKQEQFKEMQAEVVTQFCGLVRAAFIPPGEDTTEWAATASKYGKWEPDKMLASTRWLSPSLQRIRHCCSSLQKHCALPEDCVVLLRHLSLDSRAAVLVQLLKATLEEASYLDTSETWTLRLDDTYGGITQLPSVFEALVTELVQVLQQVVVRPEPGELNLWSQADFCREVTALCVELLKVFMLPLQILAIRAHSQAPGLSSAVGQTVEAEASPGIADADLPPQERRLLMMLSNCRYVIQRVLPALVQNFTQHGYPGLDVCLELCQNHYEGLDAELFETLIEEKSGALLGALEQGMYASGFDWNSCLPPVGVRVYIKRALLDLVHIHAEVYAVSPPFVMRVLQQVAAALAQELLRLFACVTSWSPAGAAQASLDLSGFGAALAFYGDHQSVRKPLLEAESLLPQVSNREHKTLIVNLRKEFLDAMRMQLKCFTQPSSA